MSEFGGTAGGRFFGVMVGIVTDNRDPAGLGRVRVRFPWLSEGDASHWARIAVAMAGPGRGLFMLPEVDDEVLVAFEHGRPESAYVLGALWNGAAKPPQADADAKEQDVQVLRSRSGHTIVLDDTAGAEKLTVSAGGDAGKIVIDMQQGSITVTGDKKLVLACTGEITIGGDRAKVAITGSELTVKCDRVNINDGALEVR